MAMEDILKVLMQSAASQQPQQQSTGGDAMSQMLGGLLGGQTQGGAGSDIVGQVIGGLLGGQQNTGSSGVGSLLGGLQQIIGGTPGTGQQLPLGGNPAALGSNDPIMSLLQPVVNNVAAKLGISPQIATVVASIALHYLLQSHPNTPGASPLNLGGVMQALSSGRTISPTALQQSGMVNDVMQATGMDEQQALRSINTTFGVLGSSLTRVNTAQGGAIKKSTKGVKAKASVTRKRR
jgi:hypothetical protein